MATELEAERSEVIVFFYLKTREIQRVTLYKTISSSLPVFVFDECFRVEYVFLYLCYFHVHTFLFTVRFYTRGFNYIEYVII